MSIVEERIQELEDLQIPPKGIAALRVLWEGSGVVLIDSHPRGIRPRLAKKMEAAKLIIISNPNSCVPYARFGDLGSAIAFDLFGDE